MTWAPQETQIAVYNKLVNDSALTALIGANKIFDHVPDSTAFPFISLAVKPFEDRGNYTYEGLKAELWIHVWYQSGATYTGRGDKQVQNIQARVDALLHKKELPVSGWSTLILRREFIDIITDPDNVTKHGIQRFKLFLGGN